METPHYASKFVFAYAPCGEFCIPGAAHDGGSWDAKFAARHHSQRAVAEVNDPGSKVVVLSEEDPTTEGQSTRMQGLESGI